MCLLSGILQLRTWCLNSHLPTPEGTVHKKSSCLLPLKPLAAQTAGKIRLVCAVTSLSGLHCVLGCSTSEGATFALQRTTAWGSWALLMPHILNCLCSQRVTAMLTLVKEVRANHLSQNISP